MSQQRSGTSFPYFSIIRSKELSRRDRLPICLFSKKRDRPIEMQEQWSREHGKINGSSERDVDVE